MIDRWRRTTAGLLLPLYLTSCFTSWQTQQATPAEVLAEEEPDEVLVTLYDGSKFVLRQPSISQDTLHGREVKSGLGPVSTVQRSVPLSSIEHIAVNLPDTRNIIVVVLLFVSIPFIAALINSSTPE